MMVEVNVKTRKLCLSAALALAVVACGASDRDPPRVTASTPASGATEVRLDRPFVIEFSEELADSSFSPSAVRFLVGGRELAVAVLRGSSAREMLVRPAEQPAALPAAARLELNGNVRDRAGNALEGYVLEFELADWIPLGGVLNRDPEQDVHAVSLLWLNGPLLAWSEQDGAAATSYVAGWDDGEGEWRLLGDCLDGRREDPAYSPALLSSGGAPAVFWNEITGPPTRHQVFYAVWNGDSWQRQGPLNLDDARDAYYPVVAAGSQAAWIEKDASNVYHGVFGRMDSTVWQPGSGDWAAGTDIPAASSLIADGDRLWLAYGYSAGNARVVAYDGASWSQLGAVFDADGDAGTISRRPRLARSPGGRLYAVWYEEKVIHAAYWDGGAWRKLADLTGAVSAPEAGLAASEKGLFAAVQELDAGGRLLVRRWDENAGAWVNFGGDAHGLAQTTYYSSLALTLDDAGWPLLAWAVVEDTVDRLYAARYNHVQ